MVIAAIKRIACCMKVNCEITVSCKIFKKLEDFLHASLSVIGRFQTLIDPIPRSRIADFSPCSGSVLKVA